MCEERAGPTPSHLAPGRETAQRRGYWGSCSGRQGPRTQPYRGVEPREQRVVVLDPVEDRAAEDRVDRLVLEEGRAILALLQTLKAAGHVATGGQQTLSGDVVHERISDPRRVAAIVRQIFDRQCDTRIRVAGRHGPAATASTLVATAFSTTGSAADVSSRYTSNRLHVASTTAPPSTVCSPKWTLQGRPSWTPVTRACS